MAWPGFIVRFRPVISWFREGGSNSNVDQEAGLWLESTALEGWIGCPPLSLSLSQGVAGRGSSIPGQKAKHVLWILGLCVGSWSNQVVEAVKVVMRHCMRSWRLRQERCYIGCQIAKVERMWH